MRITDQTHWNQRVRWKSLSRSQQGSITTQTSDGRQLSTQTLSETKHRNIEQQQNSSQEDENCRGAARGKETKSCQPGLKQDSVDASRTVWGSTRRIFVSPMDQKNAGLCNNEVVGSFKQITTYIKSLHCEWLRGYKQGKLIVIFLSKTP